MPTAYTADIADGKITDLAPFALRLARGMGACITMRDDAWDAPIPEAFEPSRYNADRLAVAVAERDRLISLSEEDAQAAADQEYAERCRSRDEYLAGKADQRARYLAMIAKVEAWQGAPEGIKEFALEQLRTGMDFDCREPFKYYGEVVESSGPDWRAAALEKAERDVRYHTDEDAKERARTDGRNAWIAQLRQSLAAGQ